MVDFLRNYRKTAVRQKSGTSYVGVTSFVPTTPIVSTITGVKWFFMTSAAIMLVQTSANVGRTVSNWKTSPVESANLTNAIAGSMGVGILPNGAGFDIHVQNLNGRARMGVTWSFNGTNFSGPNNVLSYTYAGSVSGLPSSVSKFVQSAAKYRNVSVSSTSPYAMSIAYLANNAVGVDTTLDPSNPPTISSITVSAFDMANGEVLALRRFNSAASPNRTMGYRINYETNTIVSSFSFGDDWPVTNSDNMSMVMDGRYLCASWNGKTQIEIFDTQELTRQTVDGLLIGQFDGKMVVFRLNTVAANKYGEVYLVDPATLAEVFVTDVTYIGTSPILGLPTVNNFRPIMPSHGMYPVYISGATSGNTLCVVEITK